MHTANFDFESKSQQTTTQDNCDTRGYLFKSNSNSNMNTARNLLLIDEVMDMQRFDTFINRCKIMEKI